MAPVSVVLVINVLLAPLIFSDPLPPAHAPLTVADVADPVVNLPIQSTSLAGGTVPTSAPPPVFGAIAVTALPEIDPGEDPVPFQTVFPPVESVPVVAGTVLVVARPALANVLELSLEVRVKSNATIPELSLIHI